MISIKENRSIVTIAIVCFLLMLLCLELWVSDANKINWPPAEKYIDQQSSSASPVMVSILPLDAYAAIWQHTLFSPSRAPDSVLPPPEPLAPSLKGLTVTGIVIMPSLRVAMLKLSDGKRLNIMEKQVLGSGWEVERIDEMHVLLRYGTHQETVWLDGRKPQIGISSSINVH